METVCFKLNWTKIVSLNVAKHTSERKGNQGTCCPEIAEINTTGTHGLWCKVTNLPGTYFEIFVLYFSISKFQYVHASRLHFLLFINQSCLKTG